MPPLPNRSLITGAGTGIGLAVARRLALRGDHLLLHAHAHAKEAAEWAAGIGRKGGSAAVVTADLSTVEGVDRLAKASLERFPSLDVLVLNAGSYVRHSLDELEDSTVERTIRLNLIHPFHLLRRLSGSLGREGRVSRVVFISSVLAWDGSRHGADYAASKAGLVGLARSLARELAPRVTVNVVAPGSIDTAILAGDTPEVRRQRERAIPLGRVGRAEEVADAVEYLTSPAASYLTGTTIHVNGGLRMD